MEAKKQRQDDEDVYPVDEKSFRSRLALLIINRNFADPNMTRYGAEKDEQNMEHLLKELGYKVFKHTNLSGQEIDNAVKEFSQLPGLSQTDSVFVVIMSHGNLGVIHGVHCLENNPDEFCIENIYKHLNSENCPALVDKPKVIIIQACRGGRSDEDGSVFISDGDSAIMASDCEPQPSQADDMVEDGFRTHKEKDFISLLSCTPDTLSYRHPQLGSFLIQYIAEEFKKFWREDHIEELFRKVMKRFEKFPSVKKRQMPTKDRCTLTNRFYLFPRERDSKAVSSASACTQGPSAGASAGRTMSGDKHFVDKHRKELIQRVNTVPSLLDELLDRGIIKQESYNTIMAQTTSQARMRELYNGPLNACGSSGKDIFYEILEELEAYLISDLKNK